MPYLVKPSSEASEVSLRETTKLSQSHRHWYTQADRARLRFRIVNTVFMWLPIPGGAVISITVCRRSWVMHWMCLMGSATTVLELAMLADRRGRVVGKGKGDNNCCWGFSCWCSCKSTNMYRFLLFIFYLFLNAFTDYILLNTFRAKKKKAKGVTDFFFFIDFSKNFITQYHTKSNPLKTYLKEIVPIPIW